MNRRLALVVWILGAIAALAPLLYGCGAERRGQPGAPAVTADNPKEVRGERLFLAYLREVKSSPARARR